ncbi:MAG: zinc-dependent peptidase [Cyclobacteriaceae bacterium]
MEIVIFLSLIVFAVWVLWIKPRRKLKRDVQDLTATQIKILSDHVAFYRQLSEEDKSVFEQKVARFLSQVNVRGVDTEANEEDRLLVAASAVIPIFAFPDWEYRNLNEVLLYPNSFSKTYDTRGEDRNVSGMVGWGPMNRTMILSRQSLKQGFANEHTKSNVGIHEFVHLIDKVDGATDGLPEVLLQRQYAIPWMELVRKEMNEIRQKKSNVNPYGGTSEAEFFPVISEYFFTQPEMLKKREPELYEMLEHIFMQDPADRN